MWCFWLRLERPHLGQMSKSLHSLVPTPSQPLNFWVEREFTRRGKKRKLARHHWLANNQTNSIHLFQILHYTFILPSFFCISSTVTCFPLFFLLLFTMSLQSPNATSFLKSHHFDFSRHISTTNPLAKLPNSKFHVAKKNKSFRLRCSQEEDYYLLDAPVSAGDGFSFSGGKYADGESPADEWFKQGKMIKAVRGSGEKAKDPIFGLKMASSSQASDDIFRWFCVESGSTDNPSVMLIHGFPSQAYSYRKVLPILSKDYHVIAFDWLGFGFSDKPQPKNGFDYTMEEYTASLKTLIDDMAPNKVSIVVQGYFSPVAVKYAFDNQDKVNDLIMLNPPITAKHANLPSSLSIFSNFLLGEIFSQDPLRASDKALTSSGPYKMKEDDAMVYRRPYLTSGSSGFALNAVSRAMKKQLKAYVEEMRNILMNKDWKVRTTLCWGQRDRWLNYDGVEDFCKESNHKLVELPMAGHHVQEDSGEEIGRVIAGLLRKQRSI